MEDHSVISGIITRTLSASRTKTMAGGQIRDAVLSSHPTFRAPEYGVRNLREFIRKYVPAAREESRAGMDVVYALVDDHVPEVKDRIDDGIESKNLARIAQSHLLNNPQLWKIFSNPSSPWKLFVEPKTGTIRGTDPSGMTDASWIQIPSCSAETLLQIARDFVDLAPEALRPALTASLTEKRWWLPFFEVLRNVGQKTSWVSFRRERISTEFLRLVSQVVERDAVSVNVIELEKLSASSPNNAMLRKLVLDAVARMSDAELRSLNIPLGYVVDFVSSIR
ncbi:MAG TPA: hypothetical protein VGG97_03380 [Bryobacteraceae bacterium]|jgi:hypothetical protein